MNLPQRKVVVLTSLVLLLSLTSALLLALAPPPLAAGEEFNSLAAPDQDSALDAIFKTAVPTRAAQWKYLFIHHSASPTGNALSLAAGPNGLADHFVLGNGNGCQDGEIQMTPRWNSQQPAATPPGVDHIDPDCISICVIGDFDSTMPTPAQLRRLAELVSTLQAKLHISADNVVLLNQTGTPASVGRYFPVSAFREQILP